MYEKYISTSATSRAVSICGWGVGLKAWFDLRFPIGRMDIQHPKHKVPEPWCIFICLWLTEPSEHVSTCLNAPLYLADVTGSLWVITMSACNTGLQQKKIYYFCRFQTSEENSNKNRGVYYDKPMRWVLRKTSWLHLILLATLVGAGWKLRFQTSRMYHDTIKIKIFLVFFQKYEYIPDLQN